MKNEKEILSIISYSGEGYDYAFRALDAIETGDYQKAISDLEDGRKSMIDAHKIHTEMLVKESREQGSSEVSLLMVHAQDTLMNTILLLDLVEKLISVFQAKEK